MQTCDCILAQHFSHLGIEDEANLRVLECAILHDLTGAQRIAAMNHRHMACVACQERGLFHRGITAAHYCDILILEEKAITGRTGAHAASLQSLLARQPQPLRAGSCRDNHCACQVLSSIRCNPKWSLAKVNCRHIFGKHLRAETPRLPLELLHHFRSKNALFKPRIVLHIAGEHQLPAHLVALKHQHGQVSASRVDRCCIARRP